MSVQLRMRILQQPTRLSALEPLLTLTPSQLPTILLLLRHARRTPTPGSLYLLFLLPRMLSL